MSVHLVNGKWAIGSGKTEYDSKKKAERAYRGYLGHKYAKLFKGGIMEVKMNMFVPISKFDEEQRMVYGIATCSKLDNQNEIVDWEATKEAVKDYSQWRNIREMHKPSAVGIAPVLELRDNTEELYIGAKIVDDAAWAKCKEGVYKGFSIGGDKLDQKVELDKASHKTINRVTKYMLNEISLVDRPANPACKFQTVKRDTSVHVVTITEDPLKQESARVMEKSLIIAKKVLSKNELEALPDSAFGLITISMDGETIIKKRDYPMPDKTHAINMVRKSIGDPISDVDRERIHQTALLVLGKKHSEAECPYCITNKLKGGVVVEKKVQKAGSVTITHDPEKKTVTVSDSEAAHAKDVAPAADTLKEKPAVDKVPAEVTEAPAEEQKEQLVEDEAPAVVPAAHGEAEGEAANTTDAKLDRIISLLEGALGEGEEEKEVEGTEELGYEEEAPADIDNANGVPPAPKIKVEEEEEEDEDADEDEEPAKVGAKVAEDECNKAAQPQTVKKLNKVLLSKRLKTIIEPLVKENKELKARIEKMEKQPLPRKEAATTDGKAVKVEKYQDVRLEKKENTYTEELQKDIEKANDLMKTKGVGNLSKEEKSFCERVADKMLAEKLSK